MQLITPKNKEQADGIEKGRYFLEKGKPTDFFLVAGKAGTGKTTIAEAILQPYIGKRCIMVMALAHQAKNVIREHLTNAYGKKDSIIFKSVAGALGMTMNEETGVFGINKKHKGPPPIKSAAIIICDEGSMINEEGLELIMTMKKKNAKVIFLGDIRQLPPIRKKGDPFEGQPSPTFQTKHYAILKERIRQGEDSPILPFSDFFGDNTRLKNSVTFPAPVECRKNIVLKDGALIFSDDIEEVVTMALPLYKAAVAGNKKVIKTISYRNDGRRRINTLVRQLLFGIEATEQQFVVGDLLVFTDNYDVETMEEPMENSIHIQVMKLEPTEYMEYKAWEIFFTYEEKPLSVYALDKSETNRFNREVTELFTIAENTRGHDRGKAFVKAWSFKKMFAPVEYAYAATSHKAQGSTYNTVIVDEGDIMSVGPITDRMKSHSLYTAITRAATTCIMIDGQPTDEEMLAKAIALSTSKL